MPKKCERCNRKSAIELPYGPHFFCRDHFIHFFEKRVRKTCRVNSLIIPGEKLLVACSGGKDSTVALYLMKKIFGKTNEVEALLIDEGIPGYRDKALGFAEANCEKWDVPFTRVSFVEEFGFSMVEVMRKTGMAKKIGSTCAFCGVLRRRMMNSYAKKLGAGKLVTGHNLDDEVQSILMNVCNADLRRLARLGPVAGVASVKGLVPRIKPLWECPEIEIVAFAHYCGIKHYEEQCCPFKWQAKRNTYRAILNHLESQLPGTMYSTLSFLKRLKQIILKNKETIDIKACSECGEPSSQRLCAVCKKIVEMT